MNGDWAARAADAVEQAVSVVRDKAVTPAQRATRAVVFGLLATFFLLTASTLLVIGLFRGLVLVSGDVWLAYLICGGILVALGAFCWSRRLKSPT
jgi:hypothetical protein